MTGKIKKVIHDKGFGFIKGIDNQDYFFHRSNVDGFANLTEGMKVEFVPVTVDKNRRAAEIVLVTT